MSEPAPTHLVWKEADGTWSESAAARFNGVLLEPPQQEKARIADAARLAADDIETVLRLWPYPYFPLENLRHLAQELNR